MNERGLNRVCMGVMVVIVIAMVVMLGGCSTAPVPNILIGGGTPTEDGTCSPQNVNITIINDTDKATIGDGSDINDDDSGLQEPKLDIGL